MQKIYKNSIKINLEDIIDGSILLINKPINWTSFDIIKKLKFIIKDSIIADSKKIINSKKIKLGHAGTLDPCASGLLIIASGKKTKEISQYQSLDKIYEGEITIGKTTSSYDKETPFLTQSNYDNITEKDILTVKNNFIGIIDQKPPIYSAIKINGERLYKLARQGEKIEIPSRKVLINNFEIKNINLPKIEFKINCSKGTYIRSIAHDFGQDLGVGAYLSKLTRLQIGPYKLEDAYDISTIKNFIY